MRTNTNPMDLDQAVRLHVYEEFLASGQPPSVADTAAALGISTEASAAAYDRLVSGRVIVLKPGTRDVLMAHPLSAVPTRFLVQVENGRRYYANCVWDALGIPSMLGQNATIDAACGDCAAALRLEVGSGRLERDEGVVHFAVPASKWWEDIVFACGTMLLFQSEEHVEAWCRSRGLAHGALFTTAQMWVVAEAWYRLRLAPEWRRFTVEEAQGLFDRAGLTGPFWELPRSAPQSRTAAEQPGR